jgi:hypothetical protein
MLRTALSALLITASIGQAFGFAGQQRTVIMQPPGWVNHNVYPSSDNDFANQRYWTTWGYTSPLAQLSITRASSGYAQNSSGIWVVFGNNTLRIGPGNGVLIEEARTNDALYARDMTQTGSWTAVGTGTALNAVGIDGNANSATTLTATGTASSCTASCTILQTITLGSQADTYSVWLKRVTGSGTVNITINNLTGTTACTLTTTAFTRCSVTATLANPVVGIQMTVLNDVIVADFNQMEPGGFATSPILTTSAAASRAADLVGTIGPLNTTITATAGSIATTTIGVTQQPVGNNPRIVGRSAGGSSFFTAIYTTALGAAASFQGVNLTTGNGSTPTASNVQAFGWNGSGRSLVLNGGTVVSDANVYNPSGLTIQIGGGDGSPSEFIDGYVARLTAWSSRLPDATLKGLP